MSDPNKQIAQIQTPKALAMQSSLQEQTEVARLLREYISANMVPDVDFGKIPGTQNPTLLQPGAERIGGLFRCIPNYTLTHRLEDYDKGIFQYDWKCEMVSQDTGSIVATGIGSASSYESKWRYRQAARKCPACGKEAIIKGKVEYGGGWVCFKKKDGCGAKFADGDVTIEKQEVGRIENENPADLINTIQKIANKRSLVHAAAGLARRYGFTFDQDMEDVKQNEEARGDSHRDAETQHPVERKPPITTDTADRIIAGLAACNAKWDDILWRRWLAQNTGGGSEVENAKLSELSEERGQQCIALILPEIERRKQKRAEEEAAKVQRVPATEATLHKLTGAFLALNRSWEVARDKGWVKQVVKRDVPADAAMASLAEPEALAMVKELEAVLVNMAKKKGAAA